MSAHQHRHLRHPPFTDHLPRPVFFRVEHMPANATYPPMKHPWGEFVYSLSGITEVSIGPLNFLTPPHLGLWIPPETAHIGFNYRETVHCSVYIARELCAGLPATPCALMISALLRAMIDHLAQLDEAQLSGPAGARLLRVLVDLVATCPTTGSYIPDTQDADLKQVLLALRENPADNRTVSELAAAFAMGERTLMRRCQSELGMSLSEWRQRLRVIAALPRLRSGESVETVALDLGYATSSAFIAMFKRLTGMPPRRFIESD
ncbi:AraC family transcriptional regulator [Pelagibacterium halotolerans]|uniref:Transcriptional regulator, AraC family n=1 Tax=Pelagibacterium halotolerans (strain DSM 22347 / JCM 15775 / CGMCC 1.7692 / B2) TaxID=1082931 RepID=G4R738_PELHB|nr:helix-turn-helix transcriptional regulator [Pelagibacterium halotolerans]AEQ50192.1 transcriptional regulator, AraC family [Pelagibacterium halotolerans B2]QJR19804.1 helix-turn-helix transcriptional regulator [Pelagibacterium halotolerans]SEA50243.1 transcriptional regulator, AraC family [Pelagibacterium halotolerans]